MSTKTRYDRVNYIESQLENMDNKQVSILYHLFVKHDDRGIEEPRKDERGKFIIDNIVYASDSLIAELYNNIYYYNITLGNDENPANKIIKITVYKNKDERDAENNINEEEANDDIYNINNGQDGENNKDVVALKFINGILKLSGLDEINELTDFKDIKRDDIVTEKNIAYLKKVTKQLFPPFDKQKCRYYPKNSTSWVLNIIRGMLKDLGYDFARRKIDVKEKKGRRGVMLYTINK